MIRQKNRGIQERREDKNYKGTLESVDLLEESDATGKRRMYYRFVIRGLFGKRTYIFRGRPSHDLRAYYKIGEKVVHCAGYPVPVKENYGASEPQICMECGELVPYGEGRCIYCGKGIARKRKRGR